jgi:sigma-54 dependent transcriptional regulator, acetoin dehydrogenase operon transcriptional activator AcoR
MTAPVAPEPSQPNLPPSRRPETRAEELWVDRPRQAWQWMRQTLQPPQAEDWVRQDVATSWQRCLEEYQLLFAGGSGPPRPVGNGGKRKSIVTPHNIAAMVAQHARPILSEGGMTLCLMDDQCRLCIVSGPQLLDCPAGRQLLAPNTDWSEPMMGNNGVGTAVIMGRSVAFCGEEHYLPRLHAFTTAGYPLFAPDGSLQAIIGLIGDRGIAPGILHSLACMVGARVEQELFISRSGVSVFALPHPFAQFRLSNSLAPAPEDPPAGLAELPAAAPATNATPPGSLHCACSGGNEQTLVGKAARLQKRNIPILVVGESGAGKEHLVRAAYSAGPRKDGPFIALNCASIPRELIESELFGYAAGSFTGAQREGKAGKFLLADKGVLFLDEIGDMCLDLQAVLLRVLENSEFFPVGATKPVKVDVQIFAATNVPIQQAVREGRFRRDLYYRLNGAQLIIAPLREREDKKQIIQELLEKEMTQAGYEPGLKPTPEVMDLFLRHPWPGNIRQLSNVIRAAVNMSEYGVITFDDLPADFLDEMNSSPTLGSRTAIDAPRANAAGTAFTPDNDCASPLADWERRGILTALKACQGNVSRASRILGITRGTLYKKMAQYGLPDKANVI